MLHNRKTFALERIFAICIDYEEDEAREHVFKRLDVWRCKYFTIESEVVCELLDLWDARVYEEYGPYFLVCSTFHYEHIVHCTVYDELCQQDLNVVRLVVAHLCVLGLVCLVSLLVPIIFDVFVGRYFLLDTTRLQL